MVHFNQSFLERRKDMRKLAGAFLLLLLPFSPAQAENSYQDLNQLYEARQYEKLAAVCKTDLKKNPQSLRDLYFIALARLGQKNMEKAVPVMMAFEKLHNEREEGLSRKAGKKTPLIDSLYVDLYYVLGQYHVRQGEFEKAYPWLTKAKTRYSRDPVLYFFLGRSLAGQGKWGEGRKAFQKQLELDPKDPSPFYNIACSYAEEGREKEALEWLRKSIQADPSNKEAALRDKSFKSLADSKEFKKLTAP
jgi:tetratricopeptide (TPR) repeat protein